jgi:diguanylate cyclase (GGDEF)-like protein
MRPAWKTYLFVTSVVVASYLFTPGDTWLQTGIKVGVGWTASACIVLGVRRHHPAGAAPWYWFAAGVFANTTGILVEAINNRVYDYSLYAHLTDFFWLGLYPGLIIGMALLIRRRTSHRDWASLVDAGTIATGLGLLSWVFVIHPTTSEDIPLLEHAFVVAYPVGDVVVLAMLTRLVLGVGTHNASFRMIVGSLLVFLAGDIGWVLIAQTGTEPGGYLANSMDMIFLTAYMLFGAAALHPSMREVDQQTTPMPPRLSPALLTLLTFAALIAPGVLLAQEASGHITDGVAIVISSTALFLLVVTRMAQLLRQVEAQAVKLQALARIDELTGLPNRRGWAAELTAAIERARRDGNPLSVAMLDLDHFKRFNDEYGHPAGDRLLKGAAAAWSEQLRVGDQLARYGGEEFILLCPGADAETATDVLGRLRAVTPAGQAFSAGVASWDGVETSDELVARADQTLYQAKDAGRDCILTALTESGSLASVSSSTPAA